MSTLRPILQWLEERRDYGALFVRLVVGSYLIYGSQDNVFSWARMLEFRDFLAARNVPLPLFSAILSVYAQFIAGALYILGALTRYAAAVMVINFVVAFIVVDMFTSSERASRGADRAFEPHSQGYGAATCIADRFGGMGAVVAEGRGSLCACAGLGAVSRPRAAHFSRRLDER